MRIIIANDTYYPNVDGSSYFSHRLAYYLKQRGHDVLAIAPSKTIHSEHYAHDGVRVFAVPSFPTFFHKYYRFAEPYFLQWRIKNEMLKFKPDIVHVQGHFFVGRAAIKVANQLGVPVIGTNHFMPENLVHYLHLPSIMEKRIIWLAWRQFCLVFNKLAVVTTPTKTASEILKKIGLKKNVLPISCGIDLQKFSPRHNGEYLRQQYHLPAKPLLLCAGRLAPEKNIDKILRALSLVIPIIDLHFCIAGQGLDKNNLQKLAVQLGINDNVSFLGFVPDEDMPNLYPLAQAFVMAGTVELQSLVTMEAMASGLPIIAANALALPELVGDGENGFLIDPADIKNLSEKIKLLFTNKNLRDKMAQNSLAIIQKHDINTTLRQFEELYKSQTALASQNLAEAYAMRTYNN